MKKFVSRYLYAMIITLAIVNLVSCSDDDDDEIPRNQELEDIVTQYVNNTVIVTYKNMADASIELEKACIDLRTDRTNATKAKAATDAWIKTRVYWEQAEAFLFGPADLEGIDPHIDSWPLDKSELDALLADTQIMNQFDAKYATANLEDALLGFHAIEYILFRDATPRTDATDNELKYAVGVAGDLKLHCFLLEAYWAGTDKVSTEKQECIKDSKIKVKSNWGENMINAGLAGSTYKTQVDAVIEIIYGDKGCRGISNEVGAVKIVDPVDSGNVLDVESWYSWNSIADFQDNIRGIENSYMGGVSYGNNRNESKSIYNYVKTFNPELAEELKAKITETIGADGTTGIGTIPYPFRDHLTRSDTQKATDACLELCDVLTKVSTAIRNHN